MVSVGNWASVSVVAMFGAKWSLVFSGALYVWVSRTLVACDQVNSKVHGRHQRKTSTIIL